MSDQDWIIADLNKQAIAQKELVAELLVDLSKLGKLVEKAGREGAVEMREQIAVGLENHEPKLPALLIAGVRAQTLPGD